MDKYITDNELGLGKEKQLNKGKRKETRIKEPRERARN
jgi:hypothetical protein